MTGGRAGHRRKDGQEQSRPGETLAAVQGTIAVAVSVACPWATWTVWCPWLGLAGVVAGQVFYLALLKRGGICLGPAWLYVAVSGILAFVSVCFSLVWRVLH